MKKIISILLVIILCAAVAGCGKNEEEYTGKALTINVKNTVEDKIYGIGLTILNGDDAKFSSGVENADHSMLQKETLEFKYTETDFGTKIDLPNVTLRFAALDRDRNETRIADIFCPLEFGKTYNFELRFENDEFVIMDENGEKHTAESQPEESIDVSELVGHWHLDESMNDFNALYNLSDLFPGLMEWGSGLDISDTGTISWYVGASDEVGTYSLSGNIIKADVIGTLDGVAEEYSVFISGEEGLLILEMKSGDTTLNWTKGSDEITSLMPHEALTYVDMQGTDDVYGSLSIIPGEDKTSVSVIIYRLANLSGTLTEENGELIYTDDDLMIRAKLLLNEDSASLEIIESDWELLPVGETIYFPERTYG